MSPENNDRAPLPDLKGATLELHWTDLKKLLERRAAILPKPAGEPPPVEFVLGPVTVEGDVVLGGPVPSAALKASFDLSVLAETWVRVPLLDGNVGLTSAQMDGEELAVDPSDTSPLSAIVKGPAGHRITLSFTAPLDSDAEQSSFGFSMPSAPVVNFDVRIPKTKIDASVESAASTDVKEEQGATRVRASVPAGQDARVSWTRAREKVKDAPVEPPQLFAQTQTFCGLGDGLAKAIATITFTVLKSPVKTLSIAVPDDATVADVRGPLIAAWEARAKSGADPQRVIVELKGELKGTTVIEVEIDRPWDEKPPIKLPVVRALGVDRESGFYCVAAMTTLEIIPATATGSFARVDVKELPATLVRRMPYPIAIGWKFREAGGELAVTIQRHADLPVVTGMADTAIHTVLQTVDGKRVSRSTWSIRNSQRQFVRIVLPKGATVWSTLLDGGAVKPASGGADGGIVLIPLKKAGRFEDTENAFDVEVVTMLEAGALGEKGKLDVALPSCDLPIGAVRLSLWLPDNFLYDDFTGSLEEVRGFRDPWSPEGTVSQAMRHVTPPKTPPPAPPPPPRVTEAPRPPSAPAPVMAAPAAGARSVTQARDMKDLAKASKESSKRERRADAGGDFDDALAAESEMGEEQLFGGEGGATISPDAAPMQAPQEIGVLPVKMEVPEKGLCFAFEKILVLDETLMVSTEYAREKIAR